MEEFGDEEIGPSPLSHKKKPLEMNAVNHLYQWIIPWDNCTAALLLKRTRVELNYYYLFQNRVRTGASY